MPIVTAAAGFTWTINGSFDDGALVFLNGVEVLRENLPAGTIDDSSRAVTQRRATSSLPVITKTVPDGVVVEGLNVLAVEV